MKVDLKVLGARTGRMSFAMTMPLLCTCIASAPTPAVRPSELRQQNVLVMDEGFDLSLPEFSGKVAGRYTIDCAAGSGIDEDVGLADGEVSAKATLVARLLEGDHTCHLRPGLRFERPAALDAIAKYKDRWNSAIEQGRPILGELTTSEAMEIQLAFALAAGSDGTAFHGTATASIVAHANPDVRLTLVQLSLSPEATPASSLDCPTQAEIDATMSLLSDSDVSKAYVGRPRSDLDVELDQVLDTHAIGVWNKSFGKPPRAAIEQSLVEAGCGQLDLARYLAIKGELDVAYEARQVRPTYLEAIAAGNDGMRVDGPQDQEGCRLERSTSIVVGSYGADFGRADFSNFGDCVDALAPGEDVMVVLPDGWLMPMSGTSYSAPLVARWVSLWREADYSPEAAKSAIVALRDDAFRLPRDQFPAAVVQASVTSTDRAFAQRQPRSARESTSPPLTSALRRYWRQVFWPVQLLRSQRPHR